MEDEQGVLLFALRFDYEIVEQCRNRKSSAKSHSLDWSAMEAARVFLSPPLGCMQVTCTQGGGERERAGSPPLTGARHNSTSTPS